MRWRKQTHQPTSPNFLFSLPPFVEQRHGINYIALSPSGGDDSKPMQAAVNRLDAVGGGTMHLFNGAYTVHETIDLAETVALR